MSISVPPPEFQFTGLNYNPNFWITATGGLTQSVANTLYLKKTVTDSASALETFNGGINTSFLNGLSPSGNMEICSNLIAGELYLGVDASATTGRLGHIHIGDANSLPLGAGIHINNGTTNASYTNISNGSSTSGRVNIMNGLTSSGQVNIATGTGASQTSTVNISTGTSTGTVTIGNSTNTVQINGGLVMGTGKNITLAPTSSYVAPTSGSMLGGITLGTFTTPSSAFSVAKAVATLTISQQGIYMCCFNMQSNYTVQPTTAYITPSGTSFPSPTFITGLTYLTPTADALSGTFIASITTVGTITLVYNITGTVNTLTNTSFSAIRIA